eukprot:950364_1
MSAEAFSTSLLIAFDVNENDYELGLTKIFFKPSKAAILDTIMSKAGEPLTDEQNAKITKYIVGKRIRQLYGSIKAFVKFRRDVRKRRAILAWEFSGRIVSILGATVHKQLFNVRKKIEQRNKLNGAMVMQAMYRGFNQRIHYLKKINNIKEAADMIYISYKAKARRQCLEQFFMEKAAQRAKQKAEELAKLKKAEEEKERHQQEDEAALAAKQAAELLAAAAEAKKHTLAVPTPRARADDQKQQEIEQQKLQEEINAKKRKQERMGQILLKQKTQMKLNLDKQLQEERKERYAETLDKRKTADTNMVILLANANKPLDEDEYDDDLSTSSDDDKDEDEWSSSDDEFDITELLDNFQQIARLGAKFSRHAGKRIHKKPQLRTVKVSFSDDGKPLTLSWGAGSRAIKMKDIWYISWGHYTPIFLARKKQLEPMKCFSIVGHSEKQVLDLEAYTKRDAKIWVKGLRQLIKQTDKKADEWAEMNMQRLVQYAQKQDEAKKQLKQKQLRVVKLQQDLFVMTVEAVYKELEEQKIWKIDETVRQQFDAESMYETVLKQDVAWRKWQWFVREQITNYLRENNMVISQSKSTAGNNRIRGNDDNKQEDDDEVTVFLKYYKLQKYDSDLRSAGLENLKDLKELDDKSIISIANKEVQMQTLHANKFIQACHDLKSGKYPPKHIKESNKVDQWLEYYNLKKFSYVLKNNGLNKLDDLIN